MDGFLCPMIPLNEDPFWQIFLKHWLVVQKLAKNSKK